MTIEADYRLYNCARCKRQVRLCRRCDHENIYCFQDCAALERRGTLREAGCGGVDLLSDIDVTGGELGAGLGGGALVIHALGDVTVADGVTIATRSKANGGDGGSVSIHSGGKIAIGSAVVVDARGDSSGGQGIGALVEFQGCEVDIGSGVLVDASGFEGGAVVINAEGYPAEDGGLTPRPLLVSETADLRASGSSTAVDGDIESVATRLEQGTCSNDANIACHVDTECTVGCETGGRGQGRADPRSFCYAPGRTLDR